MNEEKAGQVFVIEVLKNQALKGQLAYVIGETLDINLTNNVRFYIDSAVHKLLEDLADNGIHT